ncbi:MULTISPECIES: exopolysaccharide biosynthesis protein [unclassified Roseivivax]|uniref:exopolysaccharide biosynthesis protein n=1 Tax=Roseivivax sp. GX 12232 TaxID=2900547 RepID=UPI001E59500D|nr:exopolysaccharide biosynthesis protein [Roseivivax sp. GX 12232]MCE0506034.1 exopolysaccharide biosynthesis protein [Roseivivax sp. GX 12232]
MTAAKATPDAEDLKALAAPGGTEVCDVVVHLRERVSEDEARRDSVTLGDVVRAIGERGFGPIFLVLSALILTPLGGIPGVPTVTATVMAIAALHLLAGSDHIWTPRILRERPVPDRRLCQALDRLEPFAERMDRWFGQRFTAFAGQGARRLAALVILALCLTVPPLELVPFAGVIPMIGIFIFGLAITARDGALMILGLAAAVPALIGAPLLLLSQ